MSKFALVAALAFTAPALHAQVTTAVSVDPSGVPRGATSAVLSSTGRFVAFGSSAADLVAGDTNGAADVFLRDLETGTTVRVNVDSSGAQEPGPAADDPFAAGVSSDGRFVLFSSQGATLVPNDTNSLADAFVRDLVAGTTERVSVASNGAEGIAPPSSFPLGSYPHALSPDGRFALFTSDCPNLSPLDSGARFDVFVRDRSAGTTELVNLTHLGGLADRHCIGDALSPDGRRILFHSPSTNLVPGDTNGYATGVDLFVRDLDAQTTLRVNVGANGEQANDSVESGAWSVDSRWVVFTSTATNLVPGDTNACGDVFVKDLVTQAIERVSVSSAGAQSSGYFGSQSQARVSDDGRFVCFTSPSPDLVPGDSGFDADVFVHDRWTRSIRRVSVDSALHPATGFTGGSTMSADGRRIGFVTQAALVALDANASADVYVHDTGQSGPYATFCEGTDATCPCANGSASYAGCRHSFGGGGRLVASGEPSISGDTLVLESSGLPATTTAIYLQGTAQVGGGAGAVLADGLICVGGDVLRLGVRTQSSGASILGGGGGGGEPLVSVRGQLPLAGGTREYQVWYRNAASGFCTSAVANYTNGIRVTWMP